jgi:urea transport system ATP-binding protein
MNAASTNNDFLLSVENLTVSFDGFKAVNDLNLYVDENEIHVIIGPNGAGKTTVLDLICGRTKATEGSIRFPRKELTEMKEHEIVREGVGRKFQNPSIYEDLTVFENLEISFPRGRDVFGALTFRRDEEVIERVRESPRWFSWRPCSTRRPHCSATARSSGWRSACC